MKKEYERPNVIIQVLSSEKMICLSYDSANYTEKWDIEDTETI